jgi:hypothetical protein
MHDSTCNNCDIPTYNWSGKYDYDEWILKDASNTLLFASLNSYFQKKGGENKW